MKAKTTVICILAAAALMLQGCATGQTGSRSKAGKNTDDRILTYAYHGVRYRHIDPNGDLKLSEEEHSAALERYKAVVDAGIMIMTSDGNDGAPEYPAQALLQLDLAQEAGLKLAVPVGCYFERPEDMKAMVELIRNHPALWGYQVIDEPSAKRFPEIAEAVSIIRANDQNHPCYINLHGSNVTYGPYGSVLTDTYKEYVELFIEQVHPDFVSFDEYPCLESGVMDGWYNTLTEMMEYTKAAGLPLWAFASSCKFANSIRTMIQTTPNMATLRLQHYTNLAYGAQCLEHFTWASTGGVEIAANWPLGYDGNINPEGSYYVVKEALEEIQNRAFVFKDCDVQWVGHLTDVPRGAKAFDPALLPEKVSSINTTDPLLVSYIANGKARYLMVVSRSHLEDSAVEITFARNVQQIDREGKKVKTAKGLHAYPIEKGDALIFQLQ